MAHLPRRPGSKWILEARKTAAVQCSNWFAAAAVGAYFAYLARYSLISFLMNSPRLPAFGQCQVQRLVRRWPL
jgi:hypothetical protein